MTTLAELRAKQAGLPPPEPKPSVEPADLEPEFPYALEYIWNAFREISDAVPHDDYGGPQMLWTEIQAWSELSDAKLRYWEMQAIVLIGRTAQNVAANVFTERMKQPSTPTQQTQHG